MYKKYKNISDILPILMIQDNTVINKNDTVTAYFEVAFSEINSAEILDAVHASIFAAFTKFPDNTWVDIHFTKTFVYPQIIDSQRSKSSVINHLEKMTNADIRVRKVPEYRTILTLTIPIEVKEKDEGFVGVIKKFQNKDESKMEKYLNAIRNLDKTETNLRYVLNREMIRLNDAQIINFMSLLINKDFMEVHAGLNSLLKSDIEYSLPGGIFGNNSSYIKYGNYYHAVLTQRSRFKKSIITENPQASQMLSFLDHEMGKIPFMLHASFQIPSFQFGMNYAQHKRGMISRQGVLAQKLAFLSKTPEGIPADELRELIDLEIYDVRSTQYAKFVKMSFKVHLWANDLRELNETCENVQNINARDWQFYREREGLKSAWYSSLFPAMNSFEVNPMVLSSLWARKFLPIDLPPRCIPHKDDKDFLYYYNNFGELIKFDPFSEKTDNWNAQIIGASGSGKSFTMNNILLQFSVYNPQFAILDYGGEGAGSYRNFVNIQNGTYIEISLEKGNFSINPFDGAFYCEVSEDNVDGFYKRKLTALLSTLELMITSKFDNVDSASILNPHNYTILGNKIREYYKENGNNGYDLQGNIEDKSKINYLNLDDFANKKLKDDDFLGKMFFALAPFIGKGHNSGVYAPLFRETKELKSKDVVCFDMAGLGGAADLKKVLIPVILETIATNILGGDFKRRKMIVMDEAWRDLQGGNMADFMEDMYRTIRKLNGNVTILTQRFRDVANSKIGGALLSNTSYYYFVGPKHDYDEISRLCRVDSSKCGNREMNEYYIDVMVKSAAKRDFFLFCPFFAGLLHFVPTKEFIMLSSTHPKHKIILQEHMKKLGVDFVTPEVMESAKEEF
jgi:type IV secretory pathway VirB4 component